MTVYILNTDFDAVRLDGIERKFRTVIPDLVRVTRVEDAMGNVSHRTDTDVLLLVAESGDNSYLAKLTDIMARYRDRIFLIMVSDEISVREYKALVRAGGADWLSAKAEPHELLDIISGSRAHGRGQATARGAAGVKPVAISLVPSAGGVGNTTLAIEIGVHLKTGKASRNLGVCIVDLDFQSSHVCDYLDIEPRLQIHEISTSPDRLDAQLFDIFISRHSSGLHVFAAPRSKFDFCRLNIAALDILLDMISARYDFVLIDLPSTWFMWTSQIVAASNGIIVTGVNTIPGLRQIAETTAAVRDDARPSAKIAIAVNRCRRGLLGNIARRHHVESVLGRENIFCVVENSMALESVNTGIPMALGKPTRGGGRDIAALVEFCAKLKPLRVVTD